MPKFKKVVVPEPDVTTAVYVVCVHNPSGRWYALNRGYHPLPEPPAEKPDTTEAVQTWEGWKAGDLPEWAKPLPSNEFTGYWLYK